MHILLISGSHRIESQSEKVARYLSRRLGSVAIQGASPTIDLFTLAGNPIPLWDEGVWEETDRWQKIWGPISARLKKADGLVFVVPEWNGMVPPGFKNFLLLCAGKEIAHKPVLLVTVSAGQGGAYPVSELRASGYKNTYLCYLPEHVIVRNAEEVLNDGEPNLALQEDKLRLRLDHGLKLLQVYTQAFLQIRQTKELNLTQFPSGM